MTLDIYNQSVTRLFIAEADRQRGKAAAKRSPSFLVGAVDFHMISAYLNCIEEIPKGQAGSRDIFLLGCWGHTDRLQCLSVDVHVSHGGEMRFVSRTTSHRTNWFFVCDLADVFAAPPRAHVVVGTKPFTEGRGQRLAERLAGKLPKYETVRSRLKRRLAPERDIVPPKLIFAGMEALPII
jgi:hypothetical protein